MHMADALVSPAVAGVAGVAAVGLIAVASHKVKEIKRDDIVPLMGVLGAFVFAAQMINFTIPGTGSSGHIIGGVLLYALVGPWAAFITLCSVLIIQCLIFADGGMLALGCNIINMAAMSCLVAAPLIYKRIYSGGRGHAKWRIWVGSVTASVIGLELGALLVSLETELSGVTALPFGNFLGLMSSIHLVIGICEGVATAVVLTFVESYNPDMLFNYFVDKTDRKINGRRWKNVIWAFVVIAIIMAIGFTWIASENPDGLEWSIGKITGDTELGVASIPSTAFMPDYDSTFAGIVGGLIVMVALWGICAIIFRKRRVAYSSSEKKND
ncbi:MAG: energy-coupling factor ABC transporter permease [Muribaculaceae bacterium]|nr:energy-coupling factor ABC transporter permease [Muribaculaceae bacterium]